jgi:putative ABC transport system substrate-binding protein
MDHLSRRHFLHGSLALAGLGLVAGCEAIQRPAQPAKVARIGALSPAGPSPTSFVENFRQGLRDLGYVEGEHFVLEARYAEGNLERLSDLAAELVRLNPDVLAAAGTPAIAALQKATGTIPIVMTNLGDPVGGKLIASLSHPGGNLTGVSGMSVQLTGKRLQLLTETVPGNTRFAAIWNAVDDSMAAEYGESRVAGQSLGVEVQPMGGRTTGDLDRAYAAAVQARVGGMLVIADPLLYGGREKLVDLANWHRLPTISSDPAFAAAGGLMSYGPNQPAQHRRAAVYIDKILKGAKPSDLPVEQPTMFDLVVNLKSAQTLGLTIPPGVLQHATEVVQ